jgi:hypothetical protein
MNAKYFAAVEKRGRESFEEMVRSGNVVRPGILKK